MNVEKVIVAYNEEVRRRFKDTGQDFQIKGGDVWVSEDGSFARVTIWFSEPPKLPNADRFFFLSLCKAMMKASGLLGIAEVQVEIGGDKSGNQGNARILVNRSSWEAAGDLRPNEFWDLARKDGVDGWWKSAGMEVGRSRRLGSSR